jgi:hypothetical protein
MPNEAHGSYDEAQLEEADGKVRKDFSQKQPIGAHRGNEKLFESAAFLFANDGESGQKRGDVEQQDGGKPGKEKVWRARIGIEKKLRANINRKGGAVRQGTA